MFSIFLNLIHFEICSQAIVSFPEELFDYDLIHVLLLRGWSQLLAVVCAVTAGVGVIIGVWRHHLGLGLASLFVVCIGLACFNIRHFNNV